MIFQRRTIERIDKKLDKLYDGVSDINVRMAEYNEQLKIHIKGVNTLDRKIDQETAEIKRDIKPLKQRAEDREAIKKAVVRVATIAAYAVSLLGGIGGIIYTLFRVGAF